MELLRRWPGNGSHLWLPSGWRLWFGRFSSLRVLHKDWTAGMRRDVLSAAADIRMRPARAHNIADRACRKPITRTAGFARRSRFLSSRVGAPVAARPPRGWRPSPSYGGAARVHDPKRGAGKIAVSL